MLILKESPIAGCHKNTKKLGYLVGSCHSQHMNSSNQLFFKLKIHGPGAVLSSPSIAIFIKRFGEMKFSHIFAVYYLSSTLNHWL